MPEALLFDCDGVLADTEEGHRRAFNAAFAIMGLDARWDEHLYADLLKIAGGRERMRYYFNAFGWPDSVADKGAFIEELHLRKAGAFTTVVTSGDLVLRPGVARLIDEALAADVTVGICSNGSLHSVSLILDTLLGTERIARFAAIITGDDVSRKKPDPEVYLLARERLGVDPASCIVIEDNSNGLLAAKAAGMKCIITTTPYTDDDDFTGADLVVPNLGDPPGDYIDLTRIRRLLA